MKRPSLGILEGAVLAARVLGVFFPNKKAQLALSVGKQLARTAIRAEKLSKSESDRALKAALKATAKAKGLKWKDVEEKVAQQSRMAGEGV
jgi:hypothetical protein